MYYYHAHASALGGTIVRPFPKQIEPQASVSLPITGGAGVARIENYTLDGLISFRMAQCDVGGGPETGTPGLCSTRVSVVIEGLNILNMITADRIVARLACAHRTKESEASILTIGSHFDNLRIAGHQVNIMMDHETFSTLDTFAKCQDVFKETPASDPQRTVKETQRENNRQALIARMIGSEMEAKGMVPDSKNDPQHLLDIFQGYKKYSAGPDKTVVCSFVKEIKDLNDAKIKTCGPVVRIPQFGTVYLGEVVISHGMRRITMMRCELGSPDGGSFGVGTGTGNGTDYP